LAKRLIPWNFDRDLGESKSSPHTRTNGKHTPCEIARWRRSCALWSLETRGDIDLSEAIIDGTFAPARKGNPCVGKTEKGKGAKIMTVADRCGLPVAVCIESTSWSEV